MATWPSGKAEACKAFIPGSNPGVAFLNPLFINGRSLWGILSWIYYNYTMKLNMEILELNNLWDSVKSELINGLPENVHPWITPLEATGYDNGVLTVVTGQMMGRDLLKRNYYKSIVDILKNVTKNPDSDFVIIYDANAAKELRKENEKLQKKLQTAIQK